MFGSLLRPKRHYLRILDSGRMSSSSMSGRSFFDGSVSTVILAGCTSFWSPGYLIGSNREVFPFHSHEVKAHVVTVRNRVLLRRGDHSNVGYPHHSLLVASCIEGYVLIRTMVHGTEDELLLALSFLVSRAEEFLLGPPWEGQVIVGHLSSQVKCTKRRKVAST